MVNLYTFKKYVKRSLPEILLLVAILANTRRKKVSSDACGLGIGVSQTPWNYSTVLGMTIFCHQNHCTRPNGRIVIALVVRPSALAISCLNNVFIIFT